MAATKGSPSQRNASEGVEIAEPTRLEKFRKRITPNPHTRIENFGVWFVGIVTVWILLTTVGVTSWVDNSHKSLSNVAMYTTKFKTSKTNQNGTVEGVYSDKKHTKSLVLMKFENSAQMSAIAANYRAFLSGANTSAETTKIKSHPSGSIIMFGDTGYLGLYLTNSGGFPKQIIGAIMRADKQLVSSVNDTPGNIDESDPRTSFKKFDQWEVYFNPAGSDATHIASLDAPTMNVGQVYYDTVLKSQEDEAKKKLNDDLVTLKADLASIQDYQTRLSTVSVNGLKVKQPPTPEMVAGDVVTGNDASPGVPSTLAFKPKTVFDNGFNFDWRKESVNSNLIEKLSPKGQNYVTWFNDHMSKSAQNDTSSSLEWKMSDGTNLSDLSSSDVASLRSVNMNVQSLTNAYAQYYTDKQKYQSTDLGSYIALNLQYKDVIQNNSINSSPKAINFFG